MKLTVLMENTACREDLTAEHGLSLYIEACGKKILAIAKFCPYCGNAR